MIAAVESYLAVRRAAGFTLSNTEYLLRSFAGFATDQKQTISAQQQPSIGPAKRNRLRNDTPDTRPSATLLSTFASKTRGTNRHRRTTSATGKLVVSHTFIRVTRSMALFSPLRSFHHPTRCCQRRMRH